MLTKKLYPQTCEIANFGKIWPNYPPVPMMKPELHPWLFIINYEIFLVEIFSKARKYRHGPILIFIDDELDAFYWRWILTRGFMQLYLRWQMNPSPLTTPISVRWIFQVWRQNIWNFATMRILDNKQLLFPLRQDSGHGILMQRVQWF